MTFRLWRCFYQIALPWGLFGAVVGPLRAFTHFILGEAWFFLQKTRQGEQKRADIGQFGLKISEQTKQT